MSSALGDWPSPAAGGNLAVVVPTSLEWLPFAAIAFQRARTVLADDADFRFFILVAEEDFIAAQEIIAASGKVDLSSLVAFPSQLLDGLPITERWTAASWYRLFLPELEPLGSFDRILLLGVDAYVMRSPLAALCVDFKESIAAVCEPRKSPSYSSPLFGGPRATYFNADVLLYNTSAWKARGETAQLVLMAKGVGQLLPYSDQDVLNYWFRGRWWALPPECNWIPALHSAYDRPGLRSALIVQWAGRQKPWKEPLAPPVRMTWRWRASYRLFWGSATSAERLRGLSLGLLDRALLDLLAYYVPTVRSLLTDFRSMVRKRKNS